MIEANGNANRLEALRKREGLSKKPGESSMILVAPAGSGKLTDNLAPMLFDWEGSYIVLDPKGQLASVSTFHRQKRLKPNVIILNPFNEWPRAAKQIVAGVLLESQQAKRDQGEKQEARKRNDRSNRQRK